MSKEKKRKLITPENVTKFCVSLTGLFIAALFVNILIDLKAPGVVYVILITLAAVFVFLGAALQESYQNSEQEVRDKIVEESIKQEKEDV